MKNFKKVLALVLALATLLSFATVAGAKVDTTEIYADAKDVKYVEAVDVLTAIGVLNGKGASFKPNDTLKRSEAAKIIAMFDNGDTDISSLYNPANTFVDVAKDYWAVSYIAYCAKQGIISGGMIPKIECCVEAVRRGVSKTCIIDGRIQHSILIEMLSNEGIGTLFK